MRHVASCKAQWRAEKGASTTVSVMTKTKRDSWTCVNIGVSESDTTHHLAAFTPQPFRSACAAYSLLLLVLMHAATTLLCMPHSHPLLRRSCISPHPCIHHTSLQLCMLCYPPMQHALRTSLPLPPNLSGVDVDPIDHTAACTPHQQVAATPHPAGRGAHASGLAQHPAQQTFLCTHFVCSLDRVFGLKPDSHCCAALELKLAARTA
jgi:hypothetical protein